MGLQRSGVAQGQDFLDGPGAGAGVDNADAEQKNARKARYLNVVICCLSGVVALKGLLVRAKALVFTCGRRPGLKKCC
jgi:hypothetical protein